MKPLKWTSVFVVLVALASTCSATMTPHYATYTNLVYNSNGTATFTATLQGNATSDTGSCPGLNPPYFYHEPQVTVNGAETNDLVAPCSYVNMSKSVVLSGSCLTNGTGCNVTWNASVYCSLMLTSIFTSGYFNFNFGLAYTKSKWTGGETTYPDGSVNCNVTDWCTAATSPPKCSVATVLQAPLIPGTQATCYAYYKTNWFWEKPSGGFTFCFELLPGQNAIGTTDPSLFSCTK